MPADDTPTPTPSVPTQAEVEASMTSEVTAPADQAPPASVKDDDSPDDDFDFSEFMEEDAEEAPKPSPAPAPAEPLKPEPKTEAPSEPVTPATQPTQPQVTPQPSTQADTPPASTEPAAPQPTQEELDAQYTQWFNQSAELLEQKVYALSEEDKQKLDTNPSEVLPRMAAQLHMQVYVAAATQAANLMETMLPQMLQRMVKQQEGINAFYEAWPKLKEHDARVQEMAQNYYATGMHQGKDRATRIQELGMMAMIDRRIPLDPPPQQQPPRTVPDAVVPLSAGSGQSTPARPGDESVTWLDELVNSED